MQWLVLSAALVAQPAPPAVAADAAQVFPSRVELVAAELIVVDGDGRPIRDLGPADFELRVEGRPRRVVTTEFVPLAQEPDEPTTTADDRGFTTNETLRPGRLVLLVMDTSNIEAGRGRDEVAAASRVLDRLGPTDRVGLLTIPSSGPREEFTTDHDRIQAALTDVVGRWRVNRRRLALVEALAGGAAADLPNAMDRELWAEVVSRECEGTTDARDAIACREDLELEAWQTMHEYRETSVTARAVLRSAFEALRQVEGQKVVILVSQGLGFPEMGSQPGSGGLELKRIVAAATAARVAFYMVPVRTSAAFAGNIPMQRLDEDRRLHAHGLEMLATDSGGAILRGEPERAFERVLRETSGYYRLGFEPEGDDRTGKARKLRVSVTRPGAVVRARPTEVFHPASSPSETKGDLVAALRSPTLATGLAVRVATWSLAAAEPGKLKLLIGAEIGAEAEPQGLAVGYVLVDAKGKVAVSASQPLRDDARPAAGPIPYSASATVAPGPYTLRLAVRDGRGHLGSVDHRVEAGFIQAGAFALSDLLLGRAPESGRGFRPAVVPVGSGDVLLARCEIYGEEGSTLDAADATLEVVSSDTGAPVRTTAARVSAGSTQGQRVVLALVPLAGLAPGRYLARIVVTDQGMPKGAVVRPFTVAAARGEAGSPP